MSRLFPDQDGVGASARQRGADLTPDRRSPAADIPRKEAKPAAPEPQRKRRMSFIDKHALETLPKTIADLEAEGRALTQKLDDPSFFASDRAGFERVSAALGDVHKKLAEAEDRWLELEMLRQEIGGRER